ncbi:hypothetical protein HZI73_22240 [Vallitalea pronyensis]|uniref:Uncharacterized protein n=1 Tax=Vallitalea pronyensis TaxID=1348613 RepID=A0A8J8SIV9_9FIRM|nr:hypothetical protein [Vallitalea pronyensis]QUI24852.1 hypothetical protein HZI73_22240 [Vallitalea pronyensis]
MYVRKKITRLLILAMLTVSLVSFQVRAEPVTIIIGGIAFTAYEIAVVAATLGVAGYALVNGDDIQKAAMDFMTKCNRDTLVSIKNSIDNIENDVVSLSTDAWTAFEDFVTNAQQAVWGVSYDPDIAVDFESAYINFAHHSPVGYKSVKVDGSVFHFVETGTEGAYYLYQDGLRPLGKISLFGKDFIFRDYIIRGDFGVHAKIVTKGEPMLYWYYNYSTNDIYLCVNKDSYLTYESLFHSPVFTDVPITDVKPVEYQHDTIDVTGEDWYKTLTEDTVINVPTTWDTYVDLVGGKDKVNDALAPTFENDGNTNNPTNPVIDLTGELDRLLENFKINDIDVQALYDAILERFNYNIFSDTLKKLEKLKTAPKTPPKITINLHAMFDTLKNLGDFDNTLEDKETVFIDFAILDELQFQGVSVIEWFRGLINIGMIITTFFHIKNKVMPQKAMKG